MSSQVWSAQAGRQVIPAGLSTSKGIVNPNSAYGKAVKLLELKHTSSKYDKNEQLTFLSKQKLELTGRNMLMALSIWSDFYKN